MNTKKLVALAIALAMVMSVVPGLGITAGAEAPTKDAQYYIDNAAYEWHHSNIDRGTNPNISWNDARVTGTTWEGWGGIAQLYTGATETFIDANDGDDGAINVSDTIKQGTAGAGFLVISWMSGVTGDWGAYDAWTDFMMFDSDGNAFDTLRYRSSNESWRGENDAEGLNFHWASDSDSYNNSFPGILTNYSWETHDGASGSYPKKTEDTAADNSLNNGIKGNATYYMVYVNNSNGGGYTASYYFQPEGGNLNWISTKTFDAGSFNGFGGMQRGNHAVNNQNKPEPQRLYKVSIYAGDFPEAKIGSDGLVARYDFTDGANDAQGNFNGAVINGKYGEYWNGKTVTFDEKNGIATFPGQDASQRIGAAIKLPDRLMAALDGNFTVSLWVKMDPDYGGNIRFYDLAAGNVFNSTFAQVSGNEFSFQDRGDARPRVRQVGTVGEDEKFQNNWRLVTVSYDLAAGTATAYIDGKEFTTEYHIENGYVQSWNGQNSLAAILKSNSNYNYTYSFGPYLGRSTWVMDRVLNNNSAVDPEFKGDMADVRFYNRALSAEEVAPLYSVHKELKVNYVGSDEKDLGSKVVDYFTEAATFDVPEDINISGIIYTLADGEGTTRTSSEKEVVVRYNRPETTPKNVEMKISTRVGNKPELPKTVDTIGEDNESKFEGLTVVWEQDDLDWTPTKEDAGKTRTITGELEAYPGVTVTVYVEVKTVDDYLVAYASFDDDKEKKDVGTQVIVADGTGTVTFEDGVSGKAAVFDGTAGANAAYIKVSGENGLDKALVGLDAFTITMYAKTSGHTQANWPFFAAPEGATGDNYIAILLNKEATKATFERYIGDRNNPESASGSSGTLTPDKWTAYALVVDGITTTLYVDGVKAITKTVANGSSMADLFSESSIVMLGYSNWGESYHGAVDEFRIYSAALTDAEIKEIEVKNLIKVEDGTLGAYKTEAGEVQLGIEFAVDFSDVKDNMDDWAVNIRFLTAQGIWDTVKNDNAVSLDEKGKAKVLVVPSNSNVPYRVEANATVGDLVISKVSEVTTLYEEVIKDIAHSNYSSGTALNKERLNRVREVIAKGGLELSSFEELDEIRDLIMQLEQNKVSIKGEFKNLGIGFVYKDGNVYVGGGKIDQANEGELTDGTVYTSIVKLGEGIYALADPIDSDAYVMEIIVYLEDIEFVFEAIPETAADELVSADLEFTYEV
ncbi:MAG: LamG domain-containing protein [Oscillospiraceae bacterium]|nr:LamG domain-containing protein [Oscillospiraceae bacterium]